MPFGCNIHEEATDNNCSIHPSGSISPNAVTARISLRSRANTGHAYNETLGGNYCGLRYGEVAAKSSENSRMGWHPVKISNMKAIVECF